MFPFYQLNGHLLMNRPLLFKTALRTISNVPRETLAIFPSKLTTH